MSQENVEIVRRGVEAYNRRDLDGVLEHWAPDAVLAGPGLADSTQASFGGTARSRRTGQRLLDAFDEVRIELVDPVEVEEVRQLPADRVHTVRLEELDRRYRDVLAAMAADGVASRPDPDPLPADYAAVPAAGPGSAIDPWADGRAERA